MTREEQDACREALNHSAEIAAEFGNMALALAYTRGALALAATPRDSTPQQITSDAQRRIMLKRTIRRIESVPGT